MEDIKNTNFNKTTVDDRTFQPHLIVQALAFTAILYFTVGDTSPNIGGAINPFLESEVQLSATVGHAVLQHTAQHSRMPPSNLRVVDAQPHTWPDNCLGLGYSEVSCTQMPVPGWQVAVASGQRRWTYRTDVSGSVIKLEGKSVSPSE
ncbi:MULTISPECIES: hypothetical protein [unclassified Coleofasciculus]|uniref:hypothetical protein n=1 Tax=unclassified Coleofasciculus TaxID=2692782 RepID=UPI0018817195|nr:MULTISPECIES: hypothetical protein [unclassified Coleofasciculus]MBE9124935.1 hypothetical protein [Coleofasciculus sp. LEGE 07081]MBE9147959.1 hypothetical protein [Coleofasciculus sp. LEGE 07092]